MAGIWAAYRSRVGAICLIATAVALALGVTSASADVVRQTAEFKMDLQDGYKLRFEASTSPDGPGPANPEVSVEIKRGRAFARYGTEQPAVVSAKSIRARLGGLGVINVRFAARSKKVSDGDCFRGVSRTGVFRGRIEFEGEDRYVSIDANRAIGSTFQTVKGANCREVSRRLDEVPSDRVGDPPKATLHSCGPTGGLGFAAFAAPRREKASYLAASIAGNRRFYVLRIAFAGGSSNNFPFDPDLSSAVVRPPPPFSGEGVFNEGHLEGDLTVDFPGASNVQLTPGGAELLPGEGHSFPRCFPVSNGRMPSERLGPVQSAG